MLEAGVKRGAQTDKAKQMVLVKTSKDSLNCTGQTLP